MTGSYKDAQRPGRPRMSTHREDRLLVRQSLQNRRETVPHLGIGRIQNGVQASNSTVRRRFKKADLVAHVALKKTWWCSPPQEKITRSQYRVSESQVIVKDFGPMLAFLCRIYFFLLYYCKFHYSTCSTSVYVQFSHT